MLAALILALVAYLFYHNRAEKKTVEHFLAQVNAHDYKDAYITWGCTEATPCRNYDFARFLEDWGSRQKPLPRGKLRRSRAAAPSSL